MSKIMAAMTKRSKHEFDAVYNLRMMGDPGLFPPPPKQQMAQLERLADSLINLGRDETEQGLSVVFSSSFPGEGCSYVSYNVARYLSIMLEGKVAWVDGNFVSPQRKLMGHGTGFRELLENPELMDDIVCGPDFVTIPHGEIEIKQTQLLSGGQYENLLGALSQAFRFTIIDAPAISDSVDVGRLARPTLGVVMVVESRRLKYEVVQYSIDSIRNQGGRVLGTVLNKLSHDIPDFLYRRVFLGE